MNKQMTKDPHTYRPLTELLEPHWTDLFIQANGIRQHTLRTGGDKPPLVLLHGFMGSGLSWLRTARALQETYDVIMVDARAHGRSDGPETGFTPEILAEDVAALIEVLQLDNPILLGRSNGAVTAVLVAAAHPQRVRAILLEDPPSGGMPRPTVTQEPLESQNWFQAWLSWMESLKTLPHEERLASAIERWPTGLPIPPGTPVWPEDDFVSYVAALARFDTNIFKRKIGYWSLVPYLDRIPEIACPILLLAGNPELGSVIPPETAAHIEATWQQGQLVQFDDAGHIISRGQTFPAFLMAVRSFLQENTA